MGCKNCMKKILAVIYVVIIVCIFISGCYHNEMDKPAEANDYGVFIGADPEVSKRFTGYSTVIIDAQYYTAEDISELKEQGTTIYTYLNIGSLEDFREYYDVYEPITLDEYENWNGERWVDVTEPVWRTFISAKADELLDKGVDGFFVDNCDVYYHYHTEEVFENIAAILNDLKSKGAYVLVNGGDIFVTEYLSRYGNLDAVLDGVNQESVYTSVDGDDGSFTINDRDTRDYFLNYLSTVMKAGRDAYVIEYVSDQRTADEAKALADKYGYTVYVSYSLDLNGGKQND